MFNAVLVPLDGSSESARALRPAKLIAEALHLPLSIKAYFDSESDGVELERDVEALVAAAGVGAGDIEILPLTSPVAEMLAPQLSNQQTLVVMATRGYGRAAALVGSVATDIVATSSGPVVLVGPKCDADGFDLQHHLVLAAGDRPDSVGVLALASELVGTFGLEPIVVNVVDPKTDRISAAVRSGPKGGDLPPDSSTAHRFAQNVELEVGRDVDFEVLHSSHRGKAIAAFATEIGASLIAMTTHGRTGLDRLARGSITADVLSHATCPVVTVVTREN